LSGRAKGALAAQDSRIFPALADLFARRQDKQAIRAVSSAVDSPRGSEIALEQVSEAAHLIQSDRNPLQASSG